MSGLTLSWLAIQRERFANSKSLRHDYEPHSQCSSELPFGGLMLQQEKKFPYSWEEAIDILRKDPQHCELIYDAYLTSDLLENCRRFAASGEFAEVLELIKTHRP